MHKFSLMTCAFCLLLMSCLGANALIGGSQRSAALQPVSVEAQVGVNLALGVAGLTLR